MPYRSSKPDWAELKKGQGDWKSSNDKQQNQTVRGKMPRTCDTAKNENKNKKRQQQNPGRMTEKELRQWEAE